MNTVSKYIIIVLFVTSVLLGINIIILNIQNDDLKERNTRLSEMVALRDAVISEIDKNIANLQKQVKEAEQICNERLKARNDLLTFLSIEPNWKGNSEAVPLSTFPLLQGQIRQKCDSATLDLNNKVISDEIISKNKSDYAVNAINSYWVQFTQSSYSKK